MLEQVKLVIEIATTLPLVTTTGPKDMPHKEDGGLVTYGTLLENRKGNGILPLKLETTRICANGW